ncbi:hypothetical protein [Streptomyces sp. NPDC101132]|uniref:hypothetical protein n=1 Tax=Streptomyces sp. NPDC101132 TaxID=3366110 RepID=UPI0037F3E577
MTTAATHLRTITTEWPRLNDALADGRTTTWPPAGRMRDYLNAIDDADAADALRWRLAHRTVLDRDPAQLGTTRPPLSIDVHDVRYAIEVALAGCADVIASRVQIEPIPFPGPEWPAADRARRAAASRADVADPRRWRYRGRPPRAPYTALWLLARVEDRRGPFRPLSSADRAYVRGVAREAVHRMESVLGLLTVETPDGRPCPDCGGTIVVRSGAGAPPMARCEGCERLWTSADVRAA